MTRFHSPRIVSLVALAAAAALPAAATTTNTIKLLVLLPWLLSGRQVREPRAIRCPPVSQAER